MKKLIAKSYSNASYILPPAMTVSPQKQDDQDEQSYLAWKRQMGYEQPLSRMAYEQLFNPNNVSR
jgi:hypothetical protein